MNDDPKDENEKMIAELYRRNAASRDPVRDTILSYASLKGSDTEEPVDKDLTADEQRVVDLYRSFQSTRPENAAALKKQIVEEAAQRRVAATASTGGGVQVADKVFNAPRLALERIVAGLAGLFTGGYRIPAAVAAALVIALAVPLVFKTGVEPGQYVADTSIPQSVLEHAGRAGDYILPAPEAQLGFTASASDASRSFRLGRAWSDVGIFSASGDALGADASASLLVNGLKAFGETRGAEQVAAAVEPARDGAVTTGERESIVSAMNQAVGELVAEKRIDPSLFAFGSWYENTRFATELALAGESAALSELLPGASEHAAKLAEAGVAGDVVAALDQLAGIDTQAPGLAEARRVRGLLSRIDIELN